MSKIIQSSYVELMNCIYNRITSRIPARTREILVLAIFVILAFYFVVFRSKNLYPTLLNEQDICQFFGGCMLMLAAIFSMRQEIKTVQWRTSLVVPYLLFALGLVAIGLMHPIGGGYGFFGLMLLTVYPCLYLVWNNRNDYEALFDKIAMAFMIAGTVYFIWYAYVDFENIEAVYGGRHEGGLYNANFLSFLGVSVCCSALYYLYRSLTITGKKPVIAISYSLIAIVLGTIMIAKGGSRTAILILLANILVTVYFLLKRAAINQANNRQVRKRSRLPVVIIAVIILAAILVVGIKYDLSFLSRFDFSNQNADQFSSGRLCIWKNYAQNLTLLGHDMTSVDWDTLMGGMDTRHAHNNFLDYSYRSGIVVGVCCIALQLVAGIITLICMFKRKRNRGYEVFVTLFSVQYLLLSLIDIATLPMTNYGAFYFYICIAPLFMTTCIDEEEKTG